VEKRSYQVIYIKKARISISSIGQWIEKKGFPETSKHFIGELYNFGDNIGIMPRKYPPCRQSYLSGRGFHCVDYKGWVFIYKVEQNRVVIFNIVHSKTLQ